MIFLQENLSMIYLGNFDFKYLFVMSFVIELIIPNCKIFYFAVLLHILYVMLHSKRLATIINSIYIQTKYIYIVILLRGSVFLRGCFIVFSTADSNLTYI